MHSYFYKNDAVQEDLYRMSDLNMLTYIRS